MPKFGGVLDKDPCHSLDTPAQIPASLLILSIQVQNRGSLCELTRQTDFLAQLHDLECYTGAGLGLGRSVHHYYVVLLSTLPFAGISFMITFFILSISLVLRLVFSPALVLPSQVKTQYLQI